MAFGPVHCADASPCLAKGEKFCDLLSYLRSLLAIKGEKFCEELGICSIRLIQRPLKVRDFVNLDGLILAIALVFRLEAVFVVKNGEKFCEVLGKERGIKGTLRKVSKSVKSAGVHIFPHKNYST